MLKLLHIERKSTFPDVMHVKKSEVAYCSLGNEMEWNEMERNEMEQNEMGRNEMKICRLRNENL